MSAAPPSGFARFDVAAGHASDEAGATGLTVVRGTSGPLRASAAVVGRATGTRELLAASPSHLVDRVDAILLTGGSAYGLDAAAGVMRWMEERGRGFSVGEGVVPIVPAAVVFDLVPLGRFDARPTAAMAYAACEDAVPAPVAEGSVGAGTGCTVGKGLGPAGAMKGGVGCAVVEQGDAAVGALAVVNAFGDVRGADGRIIAGARARDGAFADTRRVVERGSAGARFSEVAMRNTTLAVMMTDAQLSRGELAHLAAAAAGAFYARISPAGTSYDGDVVFAVCPDSPRGAPPHNHDTAAAGPSHHPISAPRTEVPPAAASPAPPLAPSPLSISGLMQLEALAVAALGSAIERAVRLARGRDGVPGLADAVSDAGAPPEPPPHA